MPMPVPGDSVRLRGTNTLPFPLLPVFFLVGIFYLNFTSRVVLSPLLPVLERDLGLGHGQAGSLFLLAQLGYCGGLLASGFVSWRWNHRWTITLSTLGVGLVLLAVSQVTSVTGMRAWLVLLGVSAGLYLPSGITTVTEHASKEHWGKALAIHELAPNLGYVTAPLLAEGLLRVLSWRGVLAVLGVLAILLGALYVFFGRGGGHRALRPRFTAMHQLVRDPSFWIMGTLFAISVGTGLGVYMMMPLFLVSEIGMDRGVANSIVGVSRAPGLVIIFFSGMISDRIGHRQALVLFLAMMGTLTLLLGLIRGPVATPTLVFLQSAAAPCVFPVAFSMISRMFSPPLRPLVVSMITIIGSLFGAGAIPSALGHWAEAFSFSSGFFLLGLLTLAIVPLLLYRGSPASAEGKSDRAITP